jgi:hypothetical protein
LLQSDACIFCYKDKKNSLILFHERCSSLNKKVVGISNIEKKKTFYYLKHGKYNIKLLMELDYKRGAI